MVDLFSVYRVYFVASTLGVHSNFYQEGFRQKDLRFLLSLFLNWMTPVSGDADAQIHNTQVGRYLESLAKQGFVDHVGKPKPPRYRLTRTGLMELVSQLTHSGQDARLEEFFFVYCFLKIYGNRLKELVAGKESREYRLPRSYQVELEALLDHTELLERRIRDVQLQIRKIDGRIQETNATNALASKLSARGEGAAEIIRAVEENFPYDLNRQKKMSEFMHEIPPELRTWELTSGNESRVRMLWTPMRNHFDSYLKILLDLRKGDSLPVGGKAK